MDVLARCPGDSPVDPDAPKWTGWTPSNYPAIPVSLASVVSTAFTLACLRDRVLRPSYVVYSATTDPTRDRTERFTCLRFVHPGMLHEKSHLKCPIGQTLDISDENWTSSLSTYKVCGFSNSVSTSGALNCVDKGRLT